MQAISWSAEGGFQDLVSPVLLKAPGLCISLGCVLGGYSSTCFLLSQRPAKTTMHVDAQAIVRNATCDNRVENTRWHVQATG